MNFLLDFLVTSKVTSIFPWLCPCPCTEMENGCEIRLLQQVELIDVGASCQSDFSNTPRPWLAFSPWMRPASTSIWIFHRISKSLLIWIFLQTLIDGRGIWIDHRGTLIDDHRGTLIDDHRRTWIDDPRGTWIDDPRGTCSATWTRMKRLSCKRSCP